MVAHSPVLRKLGKINLDNLLDSLQQLDLKSLINVFKQIEINKIESFINSVIRLADQVDVTDIIEFFGAVDNCIINECS